MKKSDSSTSSQGSEDSDLDLKEPMILAPNNREHKAGDGTKTRKRYLTDVVPSLQAAAGHTQGSYVVLGASGATTSTSTPTKSTQPDSGKPTITQATLGESMQQRYPITISFVQDFHAKRFRLQAKGVVSRTLVERFSSRYAELRKLKDLACYSSKTSKDYLAMMEDGRSQQSSTLWKSWGIGGSTRFLTANISGFPRIGNVCSLSDILEEQVDEKYFLSQSQVNYLLKQRESGKESHLALMPTTQREQENNDNL